MSDLTFGLTLLVIGMGGTLASLWILSLVIWGLKKIFPYVKEEKAPASAVPKAKL